MQRYGLIGKSLSHSFSKHYFTEKFDRERIDAEYLNFELAGIAEFPGLLITQPELRGLNVTLPYKESVMPHLHSFSAEAAEVGAVNTVVFDSKRLIGHNTDVAGFRDSIKPFLAHGMERALVLGTGGASKAVAYVLKHIGIEVYHASRQPVGDRQLTYNELNVYAMRAFRLIVNTTPVGTWPNVDALPPLPYEHIGSDHLLYDLVYNPTETAFMKAGMVRGATVVNGLSMLSIQAEHSWRLWQGSKPE